MMKGPLQRVLKSKKMVHKNYRERSYNPANLTKEIMMLYELGLNTNEIDYILYLKQKHKAAMKWRN